MDLSVIIPIARDEEAWRNLLLDLRGLPKGSEILLVSSGSYDLDFKRIEIPNVVLRWVSAAPGRAAYLNAGAREAKGNYLWFLHADSRFERKTMAALARGITRYPENLLYFDLKFLNDATPLVKLNEWGALFRSRILGVPFGDQGFCIRKDLFERIGGYPEDVPFGEDHLFVWRARRSGIAVRSTGARLFTSARKYKENGWLRVTCLYQRLWIGQAWQEWRRHRATLAR